MVASLYKIYEGIFLCILEKAINLYIFIFHPVESEAGFTKTKVRLVDMMSHLNLAQAQLELLAL